MELHFTDPGFDYMIGRILEFQTEDTPAFWSEPLYHFYPQLDKAHALSLPLLERRAYLTDVLREVYEAGKEGMVQKLQGYRAHWEACKPQITAALSDAFETDCAGILNDMECRVSLNPIEPRFLREHAFDIFWYNSERGAIGEAIHEIIHFVWFHVWQDTFGDGWEEYEAPSLKWILSEMVVEAIMADARLSSINPYYPREQGGCIYPYFFDMKAGGRLVLEVLEEMYRTQNIRDFMKNSYAYCLVHEQEIRAHIEKAENRT